MLTVAPPERRNLTIYHAVSLSMICFFSTAFFHQTQALQNFLLVGAFAVVSIELLPD
jgi:hypothetical protein